ncbi:unnamed protein product, partial [Owenia fusiformis]
ATFNMANPPKTHPLKTKTCRISTMLTLTATYFLVEIIVGYITNSLALIGDSFHMLSDVVALVIGLASVRISKWQTEKNTYGWARAEVLGAVVNAVFLIALTFSIFIEALKRLIMIEKIDDPQLLLIVGGVGLVVNLLGLVLFSGHAHGHSHGGGGGHGHSHGGGGGDNEDHGHSHDDSNHGHAHNGHTHNSNNDSDCESASTKDPMCQNGSPAGLENVSLSTETITKSQKKLQKKKAKNSAQLNMRGVFLHVMGDALGSVIVIISALVIWFGNGDWKYYLDPVMSILLVLIILSTTIPLLKESAMILLQTVPTHLKAKDIQTKLIQKVEGVLGVHEFHIWQLSGNRIIASAHIRCRSLNEYMKIAGKVKEFFHHEGIHSTTIQPEFAETWHDEPDRQQVDKCLIQCGSDCDLYKCCGAKHKAKCEASKDEATTEDITPGPQQALLNQITEDDTMINSTERLQRAVEGSTIWSYLMRSPDQNSGQEGAELQDV